MHVPLYLKITMGITIVMGVQNWERTTPVNKYQSSHHPIQITAKSLILKIAYAKISAQPNAVKHIDSIVVMTMTLMRMKINVTILMELNVSVLD